MEVEECERIVAKYELPANISVKCMKWDGDPRTRTARGFFTADALDSTENHGPPVVVLLPERVYGGEKEIIELLSHESVHAYDHCVLKRDLTKCEELACSEIRAAQAAECSGYESKFLKGVFCRNLAPESEYCANVKKQCVERIAIRSTKSVFAEDQASECVRGVFNRCFGDADAPIIRLRKSASESN